MKKIIYSPKAPDPVGPYNQAILYNGTLYVSGQIAIDKMTGTLKISNIEEETEQVMKNLAFV
ncbi:MAG TPA: Rid family hydrolase, partial [Saprospiraceae bacterium]|nr:Rid family hydrolase [Saprospiraceae bacterium]